MRTRQIRVSGRVQGVGYRYALRDEARRLGKELEIDWFDAGHGHGGIETRIAWQRRAMEFVDQALAGRSPVD